MASPSNRFTRYTGQRPRRARSTSRAIWPAFISTTRIRFTRPAASARVKLTPRGQGRFTRAANSEAFEVTVYNNGELGADTYLYGKTTAAAPQQVIARVPADFTVARGDRLRLHPDPQQLQFFGADGRRLG